MIEDQTETDILAGAVAALRKRAKWTVHGINGAVIKAGEGVIAERLSIALDAVADEFSREALTPIT
jgi:hypothetical protein